VYTESVPAENIGMIYSFKISATNEVGESLRSTSTDIIAGTVPSQALSLAKKSADVGQISISWLPPADDGGTPITDYLVYWDEGLGGALTLLANSVGGPVNEWSTQGVVTAQDLQDGVLYRFHIVARNAIGTGPQSG
jgi:titin